MTFRCHSKTIVKEKKTGAPSAAHVSKGCQPLVPGGDSPTQPIFYQVPPSRPPFHHICCDSWKRQLWRSSVKLWDKFRRKNTVLPLWFTFRRSAIAWGKGLPRLLPQYNTVCIWVFLLLLLLFLYFKFFESKCYSLMKATLNYGLNFIKHVDCGREVSKEAHKVLVEKQFKIVDFYCWLRKWELYYLANMERQMVTFAI